jgi:2-polyprenyl-3-methyl-5-hydroxy-6-metoxy-1,4-benzoquinol methylase
MANEIPESIKAHQEYYTEKWNEFSYCNKLDMARACEVIGEIQRRAPPNPKICDLGCGAGWLTAVLGVFGPTLGVDLSNVSAAQARFPHCQFLTTDAVHWDLPESEFDVVISQEVIEHIPYPLQPQFVEQAAKLLKPGGLLILTTPNAKTLRAMPEGGKSWTNQPVEDWLDRNQLKTLLEAQFSVESIRSFILGLGNQGAYRMANSVKVNTLIKNFGLRSPWESALCQLDFGLHFIAVGRKTDNNGSRQ